MTWEKTRCEDEGNIWQAKMANGRERQKVTPKHWRQSLHPQWIGYLRAWQTRAHMATCPSWSLSHSMCHPVSLLVAAFWVLLWIRTDTCNSLHYLCFFVSRIFTWPVYWQSFTHIWHLLDMTDRKRDATSYSRPKHWDTPSRYHLSLTKYSVQSIKRCKPVNLPTQSTKPCQLPKPNAFLDSLAHTQEKLGYDWLSLSKLLFFTANYLHLDCLSLTSSKTTSVVSLLHFPSIFPLSSSSSCPPLQSVSPLLWIKW